jgi:hypothetical protein
MTQHEPENRPVDEKAAAKQATDDLVDMSKGLSASALGLVEESQANIAAAIRAAMEDKQISVYELHELSGVDLDIVQDLADGDYDLHDSEPITKIEEQLGISLRHL